jgi:hypothetical protein
VGSSIYVPLPAPTREALLQLAEQEYRRPKDQARLLVEEGLRARGARPPEPTAPLTRASGTAAAPA